MSTTARRIKTVFNLLQPKADPPTAWDNIYSWIIDKARVVMILAEFLIVMVFVAKVVVDTQAKGFDDTIAKLDQEVRFTYSASEPRIRTLQNKVKSYETLWQKSSNYAPLFSEVLGYLNSQDSKLIINFDGKELSISGFGDKAAVAAFESSMKASANFSNVELFEVKAEGEEIEQGNSGFGLSAVIKQYQGRNL
jgi:Tfp pilus assembly protein PilN